MGLAVFTLGCSALAVLETWRPRFDLTTFAPGVLVLLYSSFFAQRLGKNKEPRYQTLQFLHCDLLYGSCFLIAGGFVAYLFADVRYAGFLLVLFPILYLYGFLGAMVFVGDVITPNLPPTVTKGFSDG